MIHQRFAHFISFSDVEPPQLCADVHRIGALRDSKFWAAQNSASRKSLRSIALFYVFFCVVCVVFTRTMRGMCVEYQQWSVIVCENVAPIAFVDDFPLTISRHMTHVSRLLHLSITEIHCWKKHIGVCISYRIPKQVHVILMKYWWITDNSLITHVRLASYKSGYFNHLPSVLIGLSWSFFMEVDHGHCYYIYNVLWKQSFQSMTGHLSYTGWALLDVQWPSHWCQLDIDRTCERLVKFLTRESFAIGVTGLGWVGGKLVDSWGFEMTSI